MALCATDAAITGSAGHEILMAALRQVVGVGFCHPACYGACYVE